jgi:hypothetical protein
MPPNNPSPPPDQPPGGPVPPKEEEGDALRRERAFLAARFVTLQSREPAPAAPAGGPAPGVGPGGRPDDPFGRARAFAAPREVVLGTRAPHAPALPGPEQPQPPAAVPPPAGVPPDPDFRLRLIREYRRRQRGRLRRRPPEAVPFEPPAPPPANNWIPIGPSGVRQGQAANRPVVSGRVTGIAVAPGGALVYVATANGGVWRSDDAGRTWRSLMDAFDLKPDTLASDTLSCGAIALDPTNPRRVFVGSGEGDGGAYFGVGPVVTTDGGDNWATEPVASGHPPLAGSAFYALAVDPGNPDRVVAGTREGTYWREPDGHGGFQWARKDMGAPTWVTGVVAARRNDATTFYAARWFGPVFASADGETWAPVGTDFPGGDVGRIGLAVRPDDPGVVYALVTRSSGAMQGVWRLDVGDNRWRPVDGVPMDLFGTDRFQGAYDLAIAVDPEDADLIYLGGSTRLAGGQWSGALYRCRVVGDGGGAGRTYVTAPDYIGADIHADVHTLRFTPGDRRSLWVGCDGGVFHAADADTAATFEARNAGLASLTMNHLGLHPDEDAVLFCGTQDNGTTRYTGEEVWLHSAPGDGGYVVVNWRTPLEVLRTYVTGILYRATDGGQGYDSWQDVSLPKAFQDDALFYAPLAGTPRNDAAPVEADLVAFGGGRPWLSTDFGDTWKSLPDNADSDALPTRVSALAFASAARLYVGTTAVATAAGATVGGNIYRFDRTGDAWARKQIDAPPLLLGPVTAIVVDRADASGQSIYVTLGGRRDYQHVWHFDGTTWEARSGPADNPGTRLMDVQHNALALDPDHPERLFVGRRHRRLALARRRPHLAALLRRPAGRRRARPAVPPPAAAAAGRHPRPRRLRVQHRRRLRPGRGAVRAAHPARPGPPAHRGRPAGPHPARHGGQPPGRAGRQGRPARPGGRLPDADQSDLLLPVCGRHCRRRRPGGDGRPGRRPGREPRVRSGTQPGGPARRRRARPAAAGPGDGPPARPAGGLRGPRAVRGAPRLGCLAGRGAGQRGRRAGRLPAGRGVRPVVRPAAAARRPPGPGRLLSAGPAAPRDRGPVYQLADERGCPDPWRAQGGPEGDSGRAPCTPMRMPGLPFLGRTTSRVLDTHPPARLTGDRPGRTGTRRRGRLPMSADEIDEELAHQRGLLASYTKNFRITEDQISRYAPAEVPVHLLRQRDDFEAERTKILAKIRALEQRQAPAAGGPQATAELVLDVVPTGVLHLYTREQLPLLRFRLANPGARPCFVVATSWIEEFSATRSDTVEVQAGGTAVVGQLPVLNRDATAALTTVRKATLHTRASAVTDGREALLALQDYDVKLLPRDTLIWAVQEGAGPARDLTAHVAAWVTPQAAAVADMARQAVDFSPTRRLSGYLGSPPVREQVRALFRALQERAGIVYVDASISFGQAGNAVQQRVNRPETSLARRSANCLDGAVLYASLLEAINLNPVILLVPGHAVVGWETADKSGSYEFLETTLTGTGTFEDALKAGRTVYEERAGLVGQPLFAPLGFARLLDVKRLHQEGILPFD